MSFLFTAAHNGNLQEIQRFHDRSKTYTQDFGPYWKQNNGNL